MMYLRGWSGRGIIATDKEFAVKIKYHAGQLLLRWLYALALLGAGAGLCFAAQAMWEIAWYQLFALLAAVVAVSMVGQTVCCVIGGVTVDQDGWTWREGWCGRTVRKAAYANIVNVREKRSAWDKWLHCTTLLVQARSGWDGLINATLCVSEENAKRLLSSLEQAVADNQDTTEKQNDAIPNVDNTPLVPQDTTTEKQDCAAPSPDKSNQADWQKADKAVTDCATDNEGSQDTAEE